MGSMEAVRAERKVEAEKEEEIAMESEALFMAKASHARCPQQNKGRSMCLLEVEAPRLCVELRFEVHTENPKYPDTHEEQRNMYDFARM